MNMTKTRANIWYRKDKTSQPQSIALPEAIPCRKAYLQESFSLLSDSLALFSLQNSLRFPCVAHCSPGCFVALSLPTVHWLEDMNVKAVALGKFSGSCPLPEKKTQSLFRKKYAALLICLGFSWLDSSGYWLIDSYFFGAQLSPD